MKNSVAILFLKLHEKQMPKFTVLIVLKITYMMWAATVRKQVFGVSDQVRHKSGCAATEDG